MILDLKGYYLVITVVSVLIGLVTIVVFISLIWFAWKQNKLLILLQCFLTSFDEELQDRDNWERGKRGIGGSPRSN